MSKELKRLRRRFIGACNSRKQFNRRCRREYRRLANQEGE